MLGRVRVDDALGEVVTGILEGEFTSRLAGEDERNEVALVLSRHRGDVGERAVSNLQFEEFEHRRITAPDLSRDARQRRIVHPAPGLDDDGGGILHRPDTVHPGKRLEQWVQAGWMGGR